MKILISLIMLFNLSGFCEELKDLQKTNIYKVELTRVVDGDTVYATADLGLDVSLKLKIRLKGIDTPEIRGKEKKEGLKSKTFVTNKLIRNDGIFYVKITKKDKFGRWLGVIYYEKTDGKWGNLNDKLIEEGLALEYHGGKKDKK